MKTTINFRFVLLWASFLLCTFFSGCKKNLFTVPELSTGVVSDITFTSAKCEYTILSDGGRKIIARGICWNTNPTPTIENNKTNDATTNATATSMLYDLNYNTTYYVRTYATNSEGTAYGEQVVFTTLNPGLPILETDYITNITETTATCGGNVLNSGGDGIEVIARGLCWGTDPNPTIANYFSTNGNGLGHFLYTITGLTFNTTYYVRAYAANTVGIAYGDEVFFIAGQNITSAVLTTNTISNISYYSAVSGGTISSDGGSAITTRGVCFSLSNNPTLSDSYTIDGSGVGSFTSDINGLNPSTTYYVRAYATNSAGTAYGNEESFVTNGYSIPTVTTLAATNITLSSAFCGGYVINDGGLTLLARGVCWSNNQNPTINDSYTTDGTGLGVFSSNISGLSLNTNYHVRAYATNSLGTAYGDQINFTTLSLNVGDSYGGGIIAYILHPGDPGYISGETHGIIAASIDQSSGAPWGCYGTAIGGTSITINSGSTNTNAIVLGCTTAGIAAKLCYDLVLNTYSDWYLPSKDELNLMYINLHMQGLGSFINSDYWSSSEYVGGETNYAWSQGFNNGYYYNTSKNYSRYVRAVRSF